MTIHHDKLAYGKLASTSEDLTEDKIAQMLKKLNENSPKEEDGENKEQKDKKQGAKDK